MGKTLVIVESPAKAKTISKFLGKRYIVKASQGHVRDLPKSQFGVDVENDFEVKYITIRGKGEILKELRSATKKAKNVLLAPDLDREGEAIAWHLLHSLKLDESLKCRIQFNEITKDAIKEAVKNPRQVDMDKVESQQARRVLDRLVGYNLSPLLWRKVKKGLSAGRVQSVAMRLICEREEEIIDFVPEEYWSLEASLKGEKDNILKAKLSKKQGKKIEIKNETEMKHILKEIEDSKYIVEDVIKKMRVKKPAPPFITSNLQQEAYRKLNFTAKKTMSIAQQLYEGIDVGKEGAMGLITYLRTDSVRISDSAQEEAAEYIKQNYGDKYVPDKKPIYKTKSKAQDAHEAIRPTSVLREPSQIKKFLSRDQFRLYELIWKRFIASQMSNALIERTTVVVNANQYEFRATGSVTIFKGFTEIYTESKDEEQEKEEPLALIDAGQELIPQELDPKQHFTQPVARFSEATLVKTLEERGVGRPSTYVPIISTILSRGYVVKEDKQFYPTELGIVVVDILKEYFVDIINTEFTATLEENLDKIEEGNLYWKDVLREFYEPFSKRLEVAEEEISKIEIKDEVSEEICEKCGKNFVVKFGRYGKFLACPGFPDCRNTKPLLEEIGVPCPICKKGQVVIRRSKKGRKFFGCSEYPECDFINWNKPVEANCPVCGSYLIERKNKSGTRLLCSNKDCKYEEKLEKEDNKEKQESSNE